MTVAAHLFNVRQAAQHQPPMPGTVSLADALAAHNHAAGREIWPRHKAQQLFGGDIVNLLIALDQIADRLCQLTQVMRGNGRSHADGDA